MIFALVMLVSVLLGPACLDNEYGEGEDNKNEGGNEGGNNGEGGNEDRNKNEGVNEDGNKDNHGNQDEDGSEDAEKETAPSPCQEDSCRAHCEEMFSDPQVNLTSECLMDDKGEAYCSCKRVASSCSMYHGSKENLTAECEKYLCKCGWQEHPVVQKRSHRVQRNVSSDGERMRCEEDYCDEECNKKYGYEKQVAGACDGFNCVCSWYIGYSVHKHPLPPYG
ncbi:uncharacterized protein LOC144102110 isoform X2 [Amblyomma americanum]